MNKFQLDTQRLSCLVELATGTALLLTPGFAMTLIFGSSVPNGGNQMAQLFGAAIICLGLSCWSNNQTSGQDVMPSIGLTTYNFISGPLAVFSFSAMRALSPPASCCTSLWALSCSDNKSKGDVDSSPQRSAAQRKPMTGRRIQRLAHQSRRSEPVAVVIGKESLLNHPSFLLT